MALNRILTLLTIVGFFCSSSQGQNGRVLEFNAYKYGVTKNIDNYPEFPFKFSDCDILIVLNSNDSVLDVYLSTKAHYDLKHVLPVQHLKDRTMFVFKMVDAKGQDCAASFMRLKDKKKDDELYIYHPDIVEWFAIRLIK